MKQRKIELDLVIAISAVITIVLIGASFYRFHDHLSWTDSFYFTVMTVITIGYGDFHPINDISKTFTTVYVLVSVPTIVFCLSLIVEDLFKQRVDKLEDKVNEMLNSEQAIMAKEEEIIKKEQEILDKKDHKK